MVQETPIAFVVDDDSSIREALASLMRCVGVKTVGFAAPRDFLAYERPDAPSCLILDVRLPGSSGLEFQRELAAANIDIPIVFMTGHGDIPMSVRAIKAGAVEFLTKPFRHQDMIEAVHAGIARDRARREAERVTSELRHRLSTLTAREREVMGILVAGQLNKQIAATLGTTESTVKAHRTQVMRKMQAGSMADLVRMADRLNVTHP